MKHLTYSHTRARARLLALCSPLIFAQCAPYPSISEYDIHFKALATIGRVDYPAILHLRLANSIFEGYYTVDLPDQRMRRTFVATPVYYPADRRFQGSRGSSTSVNFRDSVLGKIAWFEASRDISSVIIYDQFKWDTIPHFIGVRLQVPDTGVVLTTNR